MLKIENLTFRYNSDSPLLLKGLDLEVKEGEVIHINGVSGSGKTTLLNLLCGVIPKLIQGDLSGRILIKGIDLNELSLPQTAPYISMLMQDPEVQLFFPTVEQELAFGPENLKVSPLEISVRISRALKILEIGHLRKRETASLSFGEKKLVALAALLTLDPKILLLDELTAGISTQQIPILQKLIKTLADSGKIIFLAEHHQELLDKVDHTIYLKGIS